MGTGGLFLRKLRAKVADQPTGFVWVEEGKLAGSGYPASRKQLEWLVANGIRTILTLTPDPIPTAWVDGLPLTTKQIPMQDHGVPGVGALDRCATYLADQVKGGGGVLVHCLAGEGRTGCALAAYLIRDGGLDASEALHKLREVKPQFVERAQEKAVFEYAASVKR